VIQFLRKIKEAQFQLAEETENRARATNETHEGPGPIAKREYYRRPALSPEAL